MILPEAAVRRIAMDTAEDVFGPSTAVSLDVSIGPDWNCEISQQFRATNSSTL